MSESLRERIIAGWKHDCPFPFPLSSEIRGVGEAYIIRKHDLEQLVREPLPATDAELAWEVEKRLVTIEAHCTVIADPAPGDDDIKLLAQCIKENVAEVRSALTAIEAARPKNDGLLEALKPFAAYADYLDKNSGHGDGLIVMGPLEGNIPFDAFYKARTAIATQGE